jgi:light-harvesting complex 1 beta chain
MAEKRQISDAEARTIHSYFIVGTSSFVLTAILAHMLAWTWRPWF